MSEGYSVQEPIAVWSSARGVWETSQVSMLCGHSVPFLETWPTRGMTRSGRAYALPMSGHLTAGSEFSSLPRGAQVFDTPDTMPDAPNSGSNRRSQPAGLGNQVKLLRTPTAVEAEGGLVHPEKARRENRTVRLGAQILEMTGDLLPTPVAQPSGNSPEDHLRKKPGRVQVTDLAIIVENELLESGGKLLPTPNAYQGKRGGSQHPDKKRAGGHQVNLDDVLEKELPTLLPTPKAGDADFGLPRTSGRPPEKSTHLATRIAYTDWGSYATAIRRWEEALGREAPAPTQPSKRGKAQLSSRFVEWMMGLEKGWVTDPDIGLTRNEQLRMLGNGVVSQQAFAALELMKGL